MIQILFFQDLYKTQVVSPTDLLVKASVSSTGQNLVHHGIAAVDRLYPQKPKQPE